MGAQSFSYNRRKSQFKNFLKVVTKVEGSLPIVFVPGHSAGQGILWAAINQSNAAESYPAHYVLERKLLGANLSPFVATFIKIYKILKCDFPYLWLKLPVSATMTRNKYSLLTL